jgi:hypothetical protein
MNTHRLHRWTAVAALFALVLATPAAADRDRRYKGDRETPRERVVVRESGSGLPWLMGGFVLGSIVGASGSGSTVVVHEHRHGRPAPVFRYHDPVCDRWYGSLDDCGPHLRRCRHERFIQVVEIGSGRLVSTLRWHHGDWHRVSGDWDDEDEYDDCERH